MQEIKDISELQTILKRILSTFADYCDEHNLTYALYGGTLLGAVRHGDIIPWDDDVDVCMPRPDYEKLIELEKTKKIPGCTLCGPWMDNYIYPFLKVSLDATKVVERYLEKRYSVFGIYLDIFPIDACPVNYKEREFTQLYGKLEKLKYHKALACGAYSDIKSLPSKTYRYLRRWINNGNHSYRYYLDKMTDIPKQIEFDYEKAVDTLCLYSAYVKKLRVAKEEYSNLKLYKFGDREYYGVKNYHEYLTQIYGDYMTLPPVEKRQSIHHSDYYIECDTLYSK